ncbi:hypothetical protein [Parasphingorhabdus sp.]|uniref:hypothetical protein n=1 Tax=Parasphingorhabdus sp. TaxID=2709688 RepID=UPI002F925FA2
MTREMLLGLSGIPYFLDFIRRRLNGRDGIKADCPFQAAEQKSAAAPIAAIQVRKLLCRKPPFVLSEHCCKNAGDIVRYMDEEGYFLAIRALGNHHTVEIDQPRFEEIQNASVNLDHVLDLENLWAAVILNYFDLEKGLLEAAARHMIMTDYDWQSLHDLQLSFAVRLANLLSSCRAYLDQTVQHLGKLEPNCDDAKAFKDARSHEYDTRLGYRFMEAMRNYSQHHGLPLHGTSYGTKRQAPDALEYFVATNIDMDQLRGDSKFKQTVLQEITHQKLSAEPLIREYIAGLSSVHMGLRKRLEDRVANWIELIRGAIAQHVDSSPEGKKTPGLCAMQLGKGHEWLQTVHLGEDLLQRVEILQRRHGSLEMMPSSFVSSAPRPQK